MSAKSAVSRIPSYRRHRPTGQAVVTLNGRDVYLGKWNTKASRAEYERLIGEWLAGGRCLPSVDQGGSSVAEVALRFLQHAKGYYVKDGRPTGELAEYRLVIRLLRQRYGHTEARCFGPLALKALRVSMIEAGLCRGVVNQRTNRIKRIFKWAVGEELVPASVYHGLSAVEGLRRGRTTAPDPRPVAPVEDSVVEATLPQLSEVLVDMVRFQRHTGCRPAEVCLLRPSDVDTTGDVWLYQPESHKTEHHGRSRIIAIGPKAQDVLRRYLLRPADAYCFAPAESERKRRAQRHVERKTPLSYGNRPGTNRKRRRKREPGNRYTPDSYRRAIHRAVESTNTKRQKETGVTGAESELLPKWSPNQLRHTAATEIRRQFGLEAAQVALGHAQANVTQVYAERDLRLATEVARKIG